MSDAPETEDPTAAAQEQPTPAVSLPDAARVAISPDHDLAAIVAAAGGSFGEGGALYEDGVLIVAGVTQQVLESAVTAYDPSPALKAKLIAYAATKRYAVETSGILINGMTVATDDRSKTLIMGSRDAAKDDDTFTTPWVSADGSIHTLNAAQIIGLSAAVMMHVRACFASFATLVAAIEAGAVTTTAQVDAAAWPSAAVTG